MGAGGDFPPPPAGAGRPDEPSRSGTPPEPIPPAREPDAEPPADAGPVPPARAADAAAPPEEEEPRAGPLVLASLGCVVVLVLAALVAWLFWGLFLG